VELVIVVLLTSWISCYRTRSYYSSFVVYAEQDVPIPMTDNVGSAGDIDLMWVYCEVK
jgi:hypothetical protein